MESLILPVVAVLGIVASFTALYYHRYTQHLKNVLAQASDLAEDVVADLRMNAENPQAQTIDLEPDEALLLHLLKYPCGNATFHYINAEAGTHYYEIIERSHERVANTLVVYGVDEVETPKVEEKPDVVG